MAPTMHPRLLGWPQQAPHPGALRRRAQHDHSGAFEAARVEDRQTALPEVGQKVLPQTGTVGRGRLGTLVGDGPSLAKLIWMLVDVGCDTPSHNLGGTGKRPGSRNRYLRSRAALHSNGLENWKHLEVERRSSGEMRLKKNPGGIFWDVLILCYWNLSTVFNRDLPYWLTV